MKIISFKDGGFTGKIEMNMMKEWILEVLEDAVMSREWVVDYFVLIE